MAVKEQCPPEEMARLINHAYALKNFLHALGKIRRLKTFQGIELQCFGMYDGARCTDMTEYACKICQKMAMQRGTDWFKAVVAERYQEEF